MNSPNANPLDNPPSTPLNRNLSELRQQARKLSALPAKELPEGICDFIDLKGLALAVLIDELPSFKPSVQKQVAEKIEDFLFFHPNRGRKLMPRLVTALKKGQKEHRPNLLAAIADVAMRSGERVLIRSDLSEIAGEILESKADFVRKGKAVEILSIGESTAYIPLLMKNLQIALGEIDSFANYHFTETILFALKKIGGEGLMRLMINPQSARALSQFKLEWRHRKREETLAALRSLETLEEGFQQLVLKIVDLSEFNFPFLAMIQEGLHHSSKWVRQTATACVSRIAGQASLEKISEMLRDPSQEVRMMAISSLGNLPVVEAGTQLAKIARQENESYDIRLNALYALYSQKNRDALKELTTAVTSMTALNAKGLYALLMPKGDGLTYLLDLLPEVSPKELPELFHYLLELSGPDDLKPLVNAFSAMKEPERRSVFLDFLTTFMTNKAGPNLEKALEKLSPPERKALHLLRDQVII